MSTWQTVGKVRMTPRGVYDSTVAYEILDLVSNSDETTFYIAKQAVPAGTALTNTNYWVVMADVSEAVENAEDILSYIADAYSTSSAYSVGDYVIHDGTLYKCIVAIPSGENWNSAHWTEASLTGDMSDFGETVDNVVLVQDAEPTNPKNKIWLKETTPEGVQIPTYSEFQTGISAKVNINQGSSNSGKAMIVGSDGNLSPQTIDTGVTSVAGKTGAVTLDGDDVGYSDNYTYDSGTIGNAVSELKTEINNLDDVTEIEVESFKSTFHDERNMSNIVVYGNDLAFGNVKLANQRNIIPDYPTKTQSQNGVTCTQRGRFFILSGESTDKVTLFFDTLPLNDVSAGDYTVMIVGNTTWTVESGSECLFNVFCYADDESYQNLGSFYPYQNTNVRTYNRTIQTGKNEAMSFKLTCKAGVNFGEGVTLFFGIYPQGYTAMDTGSTVASDGSLDVSIAPSSFPNGIDGMMHSFTATYHPTVEQYVNRRTKLAYTRPEDFGAVGDGYSDDYEALNACVAFAIANNIPIRGYGKYSISSSVDIVGNKLDVYLYSITYTGNNYAIGYQGNNSTLDIEHITSNGAGIYINATTATTLYNRFVFNTITATKDGVQIYANYSIYQNRLNFARIRAGASYCCILITRDENTESGYISEWNIIGGYLSNGLWGIKGIMNDTMKFDVHTENLGSNNAGGAFYSTNGSFPSIVYARAGEIVSSHTMLKVSGEFQVQAPPFMFPLLVPLVAIDITDITLPSGTLTDTSAYNTNIIVQSSRQSSSLLTKSLIIWGNRFQFPQYMYRTKSVTEDIDMTDQYYNGIIPQRFVSDNVVADINLHPTYAANCLNTFIVEQKNGGELDVYDYVGTKIFDGSEYGNGVFELTAYATEIPGGGTWLKYDMSNQEWLIRQVT